MVRRVRSLIRCSGIPADRIHEVWPMVATILEPAIRVAEHNEGDREDVYAALIAGRKQLYVADDEHGSRMVLVTCIEDRPDGKICYLAYLAGTNLRAFMQLQPRFVDWARSLGCVAMESTSPKAMMRIMGGWKLVGRDGALHRLRFDI